MSVTTLFSEHCRNCMRLLVNLDALMEVGQGEEPEADALRDEMDTPWRYLSVEETEMIRGLSVDLYENWERPDNSISTPTGPAESQQIEETKKAFATGDWLQALTLLRQVSRFLQATEVAYMRARCWLELGVPDNAVAFLRHATKHEPVNQNYRWLLLDALIRAERLDEAKQEAATILAKVA